MEPIQFTIRYNNDPRYKQMALRFFDTSIANFRMQKEKAIAMILYNLHNNNEVYFTRYQIRNYGQFTQTFFYKTVYDLQKQNLLVYKKVRSSVRDKLNLLTATDKLREEFKTW